MYAAGVTFAEETPERERINVVTEQWPPFTYEQNGEVKGIATDVVTKVLSEAGYDYQIKVYPWMRTMEYARRNKNTVIYALIKTEERAREFKMIGQIIPTDTVNFYKLRRRTDIKGTSLNDLRRYKLAAGLGSAMHDFLIQNGVIATLTPETIQAMYLLERGRVDLVLQSETVFKSGLTSPDAKTESPFIAQAPAFKIRGFMALGPLHDKDVAQHLRKAYDKLKKAGQIPAFK